MEPEQMSLSTSTPSESSTLNWESFSAHKLRSGGLPYRRQNVLKIDRDDDVEGILGGPGDPFASAIVDSLNVLENDGMVELLCYPGRERWQTYFTAYPADPSLDQRGKD